MAVRAVAKLIRFMSLKVTVILNGYSTFNHLGTEWPSSRKCGYIADTEAEGPPLPLAPTTAITRNFLFLGIANLLTQASPLGITSTATARQHLLTDLLGKGTIIIADWQRPCLYRGQWGKSAYSSIKKCQSSQPL